MSRIYDALCAEIRRQTAGHDGDAVAMVGEQLMDITRGDDCAAEILLTDLGNKDVSIEQAEKKIKAYADELHRKAKGNCVCVSPKKAEEILRAFYGLPEAGAEPKPASAEIDPFSFL